MAGETRLLPIEQKRMAGETRLLPFEQKRMAGERCGHGREQKSHGRTTKKQRFYITFFPVGSKERESFTENKY